MIPFDFSPVCRTQSTDAEVWAEVFFNNSYHLAEFTNQEVIIDIGAHTGAFTCACLARGGRRISSFEPDPENYSLAKLNIRSFADSMELTQRPRLYGGAIWRSDRAENLVISVVPQSVFSLKLHPAAQSTICENGGSHGVRTWGLDSILNHFDFVSLLKLDCEGAEWPILYTAHCLAKVKRIVVEVHSLSWKSFELDRPISTTIVDEFSKLDVVDLIQHLQDHGLKCCRNEIQWNLFGNPDFYYGLLEFEAMDSIHRTGSKSVPFG